MATISSKYVHMCHILLWVIIVSRLVSKSSGLFAVSELKPVCRAQAPVSLFGEAFLAHLFSFRDLFHDIFTLSVTGCVMEPRLSWARLALPHASVTSGRMTQA